MKFLNKFSDLRNLSRTLHRVVSALCQLFIKVWQEVLLSAMSEQEQLQDYFKWRLRKQSSLEYFKC